MTKSKIALPSLLDGPLLDLSADPTLIVDAKGIIVRANRQTHQLFGYETESLVGQELEILVPEKTRKMHAQLRADFFSNPKTRPMSKGLELEGRAKDGRLVPVQVSLSPIETERGSSVVVTVFDNTERSQTLRQLEVRAKLFRMMTDTAEHANNADFLDEAIEYCLERICAYLGWPVGHAYKLGDDGAERLVSAGIWHLSDPQRLSRFRQVTENTTFDRGIGLPGRVWKTGKPAWIEDVTKDPNFPRAKLADDIGVRAGFALPIRSGANFMGALEFFTEEVLTPDDSLLRMLSQIGLQLGQVADRVQARNDILQQTEFLNTILESSPVGVAIVDRDGTWLFVNSRFVEMLGTSREKFLTSKAVDWYANPEDRERIYDRLLKEGYLHDVEIQAMRADGTPFWVLASFEPTEKGDRRQFFVWVSDITKRRHAQEELRLAKEQAETALEELKTTQEQLLHSRKLASLGELTAGIAHEIKNPLNFVNNFAEASVELIEELEQEMKQICGGIDSQARNSMIDLFDTLKGNLGKINDHGRRADGIVQSMLLHAHDDEELDRVETALIPLVSEALKLAYHGERAKDKSFRVRVKEQLEEATGTAEVMPQAITRLLLNLIGNAFYAVKKRAREAGERDYQPTVCVAARGRGDRIEILVRDNGTGFPKDIQEKLFEPFFTTKPPGEGTGLGLSICYDIVRQHGGKISVDGAPGTGAEFVIELPRFKGRQCKLSTAQKAT